jgi:hypothetical protein
MVRRGSPRSPVRDEHGAPRPDKRKPQGLKPLSYKERWRVGGVGLCRSSFGFAQDKFRSDPLKRGGVGERARCIVPLQDLPRDENVFRRTPER